MAEYSGPFPGTNDFGDVRWRVLVAAQNPDGVIAGHGSPDLQVTAAGDGLSVNVAAGHAAMQGSLYHNDLSLNKLSNANGGASGRPDRLVLRYTPGALPTGSIAAVVVEGTVGGSAPPALTQDPTGVWEIPLARWVRAAGGGITSLINERQFINRDGQIVISDAAITSAVPLSTLFPSARAGQQVLSLPSAREYRYSGSFWERVDPGPLLETSKVTTVLINSTTGGEWWSGSGSQVLSGTFIAPASGRVDVYGSARVAPRGGHGWVQVRIFGPAGFDSGTAPADHNNSRAFGCNLPDGRTAFQSLQRRETLALTPGGVYTAVLQYSVAGAGSNQGGFDQRRIRIERSA